MRLCHVWLAQYSPATVTLSFVRWLDIFGYIYFVIASILGKSSDVAFRISVSEPSFYSIYFEVTLHDSQISFVLCHPSAYHMIVK